MDIWLRFLGTLKVYLALWCDSEPCMPFQILNFTLPRISRASSLHYQGMSNGINLTFSPFSTWLLHFHTLVFSPCFCPDPQARNPTPTNLSLQPSLRNTRCPPPVLPWAHGSIAHRGATTSMGSFFGLTQSSGLGNCIWDVKAMDEWGYVLCVDVWVWAMWSVISEPWQKLPNNMKVSFC